MHKTFHICRIVLILLFLSAAIFIWLNTGKPVEQESIVVGGAFSLTGFASQSGEADRNGALLAIEEINNRGGIHGHQVKLIVEDTQSDNIKTTNAVQKLITINHAKAIVGPTWLDSFQGATPVIDRSSTLAVTPSASISAIQKEKVHPSIFSTFYKNQEQMEALVKYLSENNIASIATFFDNDLFWQDIKRSLKEATKNSGPEIASESDFQVGEVDFRTAILKLKTTKIQTVVFGLTHEQSRLSFLRQIKELDSSFPLYTTESVGRFLEQPEFLSLATGIYFITPSPASENFSKLYRAKFNKDPILTASNSYDATQILLEAILQTDQSREAMRQYILTHSFETATFGRITFDEMGGIVGSKFELKMIQPR